MACNRWRAVGESAYLIAAKISPVKVHGDITGDAGNISIGPENRSVASGEVIEASEEHEEGKNDARLDQQLCRA